MFSLATLMFSPGLFSACSYVSWFLISASVVKHFASLGVCHRKQNSFYLALVKMDVL